MFFCFSLSSVAPRPQQIRKKIQRGQYETLAELADDFVLLFNNAMRYNQDESKIHQDAKNLLKQMNMKKKELEKYGIEGRGGGGWFIEIWELMHGDEWKHGFFIDVTTRINQLKKGLAKIDIFSDEWLLAIEWINEVWLNLYGSR